MIGVTTGRWQFDGLTRIGLAAVLALAALLLYNRQQVDVDNLALGTENQPATEVWSGRPITASRSQDIAQLIAEASASHVVGAGGVESLKSGAIVWIGNSQLHAINQFQAGDHLAPYWLAKLADCHGCGAPVGLSLANANFQEYYALWHAYTTKAPARALIIKLVYDKLREDGLRTEMRPLLTETVRSKLANSAIGREMLMNYDNNRKEVVGAEKTEALTGFVQQHIEDWLVAALGKVFPLWSDRANLRGRVLVDAYDLRNAVLGITPSSVRPMIMPRYERNMRAFGALVADAKAAGVPVLVYIAPIRQDVPIPYDLKTYRSWIAEVEQFAQTQGIGFLNLERQVPDNLWGSYRKGNIDFMHFQGPGHKILADRLWPEIKKLTDR
jgi:hypothetical protein